MPSPDTIVRIPRDAVIEEASPWWTGRPSGPLVFRDIFDPTIADTAVEELNACRSWSSQYAIVDEAGVGSPTTLAGFRAAQPRRRYYMCEVMSPDVLTATQACTRILKIMCDGWLTDVCAALTGTELRRHPWMNVSRYRKGSFLGGHNDVHDDRVIGAIVYLNRPDHTAGAGGEFFLRAPSGDITWSAPLHNSLALFPFREELFHGVTPVKDPKFVRHAIGAHFMARTEDAHD
jgi:hypothetical protein